MRNPQKTLKGPLDFAQKDSLKINPKIWIIKKNIHDFLWDAK